MSARTLASVLPRQSPSSLIRASNIAEADPVGSAFFMRTILAKTFRRGFHGYSALSPLFHGCGRKLFRQFEAESTPTAPDGAVDRRQMGWSRRAVERRRRTNAGYFGCRAIRGYIEL